MTTRLTAGSATALALALSACHRPPIAIAPTTVQPLLATAVIPQDTTPKEDVRLLAAEVYLRTYLQLFGGIPPVEAQQRARGNEGTALFDNWNDYLAALGFPDYRNDLPRSTQTNGLMMATFDRLGMALCARAAEHDLRDATPLPQRLLFAFANPPATPDRVAFAPAFDLLHRTFLGYPARLAPAGRTDAFFDVYRDIVARHADGKAPRTRLTPVQAGWMAVCLGLVRHPEFHTY